MRNIKLTVSYDGSNYFGFQIQPDKITIQSQIQKALKSLFKEDIKIFGSSRTDAKVHAQRTVCNFHLDNKIECKNIVRALNTKLNPDIRVLEAKEVYEEFHSRIHSIGKSYRYRIYTGEIMSVFERNYAWNLCNDLDIEKMNEACQYIIGTHEFDSFKAAKGSAKTSRRTVYELKVSKDKDIVYIDIRGNGFLYNMVRIIAGTLVDVGTGKIKPSYVKDIIDAKDRTKASKTAPACGLFLMEVYY
ncbi:tRNA pseudouridine(38-40) synthase TruA [Peptostreptococcaceae bacterium AGR-M142]